MARSTKADKARQLNAAHAMLQRNIPLPEAMQRLARAFEPFGSQSGSGLVDVQTIHAGRALVGSYPFPCLKQVLSRQSCVQQP
jgi:hypothetical protein